MSSFSLIAFILAQLTMKRNKGVLRINSTPLKMNFIW